MPINRSGSNAELAMAATVARMIQPTASSRAAAEMVIVARRVRVMPHSIIKRPKIGRAVMDMAVPMNKAKGKNLPRFHRRGFPTDHE